MRRSRHGHHHHHHVVTALVEEDGDARITLTGHLGGDAVDGPAVGEAVHQEQPGDRAGYQDRREGARPPGPVSAIRDDRRAAPRTLLTMSDQGSDQASLVRGPPPGPYPSHA